MPPSHVGAELLKLQRKFRVMEAEKTSHSDSSQAIIRKQRAALVKLTRENKKIKHDLGDMRSFARRVEKDQNRPELEMVAVDLEQKNAEIEEMEMLDSELGKEVTELGDFISSLRRSIKLRGGLKPDHALNNFLSKQHGILEGRLAQKQATLATLLTDNMKIRSQIDMRRREKTIFDSIKSKLSKELENRTSQMSLVVEQANAAYESRDLAHVTMRNLKHQADKEHMEFENEWKELAKLIEDDRRMKDFMKARVDEKEKIKRVQSLQKLAKSRWSNVDVKDVKVQSGNIDTDTRSSVIRSCGTTSFDNKRLSYRGTSYRGTMGSVCMNGDLNGKRKIASKVDFEDVMNKIESSLTTNEVDLLITLFKSWEEQNFSLYNKNNEISAEILLAEEELENMTQSANGVVSNSDPECNTTTGQKTPIEALNSTLTRRLNETIDKTQEIEQKYLTNGEHLKLLCGCTKKIYTTLGCTPTKMIVDHNVIISCIGIIESKVDELIWLTTSMNSKANEGIELLAPKPAALLQKSHSIADVSPKNQPPIQQPISLARSSSCVNLPMNLPSTFDDSSSDAEDYETDEEFERIGVAGEFDLSGINEDTNIIPMDNRGGVLTIEEIKERGRISVEKRLGRSDSIKAL